MIVEWVLACLPWCTIMHCVCVWFFGVPRGYFARGQLTFLFFWFLGLQAWSVRRIQLRRRPRMPSSPTPKPQFNNLLCKCSKELSFGPFTLGGRYMRSAEGSLSITLLSWQTLMKESDISSQSAIILKICKLLFHWGGVCLVVGNFLKNFF